MYREIVDQVATISLCSIQTYFYKAKPDQAVATNKADTYQVRKEGNEDATKSYNDAIF